MYKHVLELKPEWLDNLAKAKRRQTLPTVLSENEVRLLFSHMKGVTKLMAELIYGTGMRVNECTQLRMKDVDFDIKTITIRHPKGNVDRVTILPEILIKPLQKYFLRVIERHKVDCLKGAGYVPLPRALYKKYPKAAQSLAWQYIFASTVIRLWPQTGQKVRWHCSVSTPQRAFKLALSQTSILKHASIHTLRIVSQHTFYRRERI